MSSKELRKPEQVYKVGMRVFHDRPYGDKSLSGNPKHEGYGVIVLVEGNYVCWNYTDCDGECSKISGSVTVRACNGISWNLSGTEHVFQILKIIEEDGNRFHNLEIE